MKWHTQPKYVSPLNVVTRSNGKQRFILDLGHVNQFLMVHSFRMDTLNLLTDLADLDDLMFSLDLASGYHQVDMIPDIPRTLGFNGRVNSMFSESFLSVLLLPPGAAQKL